MFFEKLFNAFGKKAIGQIAAAVVIPPLVCFEFIHAGWIRASPRETLGALLASAGLGLVVGPCLVLVERRGCLFVAAWLLIGLVILIAALLVFDQTDVALYWRLLK